MKIQLVSDLHLEFGDIELKNAGADVLLLAGDISIVSKWREEDHAFFKRVSGEFKHVIYILGNHEHYDGDFLHTYTLAKHILACFNNITVLDIGNVVIDDVVFVGGTLWTDIGGNNPTMKMLVRRLMNDYHVIKKGVYEGTGNTIWFSPDDSIQYHYTMKDYIQKVYQEEDANQKRRMVVVGHHAPSNRSVSSEYYGDNTNCAYATELSSFIADKPLIKLWVHGHMHSSSDYVIGKTRVVCNPRGYHGYGTNSSFDPNLILEV